MTAPKQESLWAMVGALGLITIVAGLLNAGVYSITAEPIREAESAAQIQAIRDVAPGGFDNDPVAECQQITPQGETMPVVVFPLKNGRNHAGLAVESYSSAGFGGDISVMVGFDANGTLTGYQVLKHSETPGLGSKMNDWFRDKTGHRSVIGREDDATDLKVAKDGGDVDAITAATISSRAFLDAVNRARKCFRIYTTNAR